MKLAYPVLTPDAQSNAMAFCGDFYENIMKIKEYGYTGVELLVRDIDYDDEPNIIRALEKENLEVAAIGLNPVFSQDKLFLLSEDEKIRKQAVERIKRIIYFAKKVKAPVLVGKFRGNTLNCGYEESMNILAESFYNICSYAKLKGVRILIEPQSKAGIDNLNTVKETVDFIKLVGADNLGILYDFFHGEIAEEIWLEAIEMGKETIGFIHCSDRERLVPGRGGMDIKAGIEKLFNIGYDGYISLEVKQLPNSLEVCRESQKILTKIIASFT
ncbi:MAG: sugar phosphate isomerase/epimerase family protein [Lachnospiraceae bacterium]|nr:sugar phosphate isomerase/epimerase family protein [Lachnospiraceae bacterium]